MEFELFYYVCKYCETRFNSPTTKNKYGEFLMRSNSGELAYLNASEDSVFKEFSSLFDANKKNTKHNCTTIREEIQLIHDTFGFACDPAQDKTYFQISNKAPCPTCGRKEFQSWGPTKPPEFIELNIKPVTHANWNNLSQKCKSDLTKAILNHDIE